MLVDYSPARAGSIVARSAEPETWLAILARPPPEHLDAIPSRSLGGPATLQRTEKGGPCCKQRAARICDSIVPARGKVRHMKSTDPLRSVNSQFPEDDAPRNSAAWATILGVQVERIPDLFRERNVPRKYLCRDTWAKPSDVWNAFPFTGENDRE